MLFSLALAMFVGVLIVLTLVRKRLGSAFEVKNTDIVLGLLPVVLYLFTAGKITKFEYGDLKIETAFLEAAQASVTEQIAAVSDLPVRTINASPKGGPDMIPSIARSGSEALTFTIGYTGYAGQVIEEYIKALQNTPVRYAIFQNTNFDFVGMMHLHDISSGAGFGAYALAAALNSGDTEPIFRQPHFIRAADAITKNATKQDALKRMEDRNLEFLPVLGDGKFIGIVERSRLTSSLLIEVASRLETARN